MPAKELTFSYATNQLYVKQLENKDILMAINGRTVRLDHSAAHLLKLWLEEHLKI